VLAMQGQLHQLDVIRQPHRSRLLQAFLHSCLGGRLHRRVLPFLCHDGVTRHMRLSLFVYPCDLMEGYKVSNIRQWTWRSTTRSDLFTMALPSEFDQPDPQPPPVRRTQELMRRVRVALPSFPLQARS